MDMSQPLGGGPLLDRVADQVLRSTHGRIRNLSVREETGVVMVSGEVRTCHAKQLALQGALELLSGERLCERITVVRSPLVAR